MIYEFKLPDIGEGLTEGEVVKWHVKEGEAVKENQPLCNVLTDKAEVEIPSPKSGKILKLMAKEGEKVKVHAPLVTFELDGAQEAAKVPAASAPAAKAPVAAPAAKPPTAAPAAKPPAAAQVQKSPASAVSAPSAAPSTVSATPAVRKLASDLKVELSGMKGTGPAGRITEEDVRKAARALGPQGPAQPAAKSPAAVAVPEEKIPFIGIRRRTAEKMAQSARTVAHVTHMDEADFTALVKLRAELKGEAEKKGVKLSYLPFIMRALARCFKEYPDFNAALDEPGGHIVRKLAYNIGIAVSAEQGLVVPVIKGVEAKDLWALASDVNRLSEKVRAGKIEVSELQGGTFTITNIGPIGGLFATPIVNFPEVAILGVMKLQKRPVVRDLSVVVREMVNLVLSFDHRVIDGAQAAGFMNTLVKHLENPRTLL